MTHTDDLSNWTELDDSIADIIVGYTESMNDDEGKSHIDRIIAAIYADIAARALSDDAVETVAIASHRAGRTQPLPDGIPDAMIRDSDRWKHGKRVYLEEAHAGITAMLLALGITESEAE